MCFLVPSSMWKLIKCDHSDVFLSRDFPRILLNGWLSGALCNIRTYVMYI